MNMAQRTSSAAELTMNRKGAEVLGTPVSLLEFSPASSPTTGLFYVKNDSKSEHGDWVVLDGFYLDSHGGRPPIAILVHKELIDGVFSEDKNVPSQINRAGAGVYFLNRDMAEYCVKKMLESNSTIEHATAVCHGKTYNNLVDQLEDRDQAGHFEDGDGKVLVVNAEVPDGEAALPVVIGLTEILVNKKLQLVHVVAQLERTSQSPKILALHDRQTLVNAQYFSSEPVARYNYRDRIAGCKLLASLRGGSYEDITQHLIRNSK